jgi:hypothetical protein
VVVEMVADRPEKIARLVDLVRLARDEDAEPDQIGEFFHAPACARRPEPDVEVAKPAGAVLHVGLEQVDRCAEPLVALGDLRLEPSHERVQLAVAEHPAEGPLFERLPRGHVARDGPPIEERRCRGQVVAGRGERVGHADDLVPDAHACVPQGIEQRLGDGTDALGRLGGEQPNVQVALQPDHAAAVPADRREEDGRPSLLLLHGGEGGRVQGREQAVHDLGVAASERETGFAARPEHAQKVGPVPVEVGPELGKQVRGDPFEQGRVQGVCHAGLPSLLPTSGVFIKHRAGGKGCARLRPCVWVRLFCFASPSAECPILPI